MRELSIIPSKNYINFVASNETPETVTGRKRMPDAQPLPQKILNQLTHLIKHCIT